jgi:predicted choloylglycine hydrolase
VVSNQKNFAIATFFLFMLFFLLNNSCLGTFDSAGIAIQSADKTASLAKNGALYILRLNGNTAQNGYNYGRFLAPQIMAALNNYVGNLAKIRGYSYEKLAQLQKAFAWDESSQTELTSMLAGIENALGEKDRQVSYGGTSHTLTITDLKILNTLADWACSSFSAWGSLTKNGESIMARNLDYYLDPSLQILKSHVLVAYASESGKRWINFALTGMIGCLSGMNEDGVCGVIHNTNFFRTTDTTGYIPRTLVLRRLLETLDGQSDAAEGENLLESMPNMAGNNFFICFPAKNRSADASCVYEYDGKADYADGRVSLRLPSDNGTLPSNSLYDQTLPSEDLLINTNHYLKRRIDAPSQPTNDSALRYQSLKTDVMAAAADGDISLEEARLALSRVGGTQTVHSVIFLPDRKWMRLFPAIPDKGGFDSPAIDFYFEDLY